MAEKTQSLPLPFFVKDCVLVAMATGYKAQTLTEFRDRLKTISGESIYYHFWRQSIEASLVPGAFYNDFSHWAHYHLHDDILAERLALIDPSGYVDLEKLRTDVIDIIENRLDEQENIQFHIHTYPFHFIQSKIVVFKTLYKMDHPKDLVKILPIISNSSIFYHFIDARRRETITWDDFSSWLHSYGTEFLPLIEKLKQIDPYFIPLSNLQQKLSATVTEYFLNKK